MSTNHHPPTHTPNPFNSLSSSGSQTSTMSNKPLSLNEAIDIAAEAAAEQVRLRRRVLNSNTAQENGSSTTCSALTDAAMNTELFRDVEAMDLHTKASTEQLRSGKTNGMEEIGLQLTSNSDIFTNDNSPHLKCNAHSNNSQYYTKKPETHTSPSISGTSRQSATQNFHQPHDCQDTQHIITQLQKMNIGQSELITKLKICAAVLENELQHARKDKEVVEKSLRIVIESMARFHQSDPTSFPSTAVAGTGRSDVGLGVYVADQGEKIKELEKEIDVVRRENRRLRRREKEFGYKPLRVGDDETEEKEVHVNFRTPGEGASGVMGKGKEKMEVSFEYGNGPTPEQLVGSWGNENADPSSQHNGLTSQQLIGSWGNPSFGVGEAGASAADNLNKSFDSGSTTVPNTPVFGPTSFNASFADVGLHSLEENMDMDNDGFPPAISFNSSSPNSVEAPRTIGDAEEEKDIDEQLLDQQAAMTKFKAMPKPSVLRVGFEVEGTKRGDDYDSNALRLSSHPPSYHRSGSMRDYNRFGPNQPPSGPRALRSESQLELKIPADLSKDKELWEEGERKEAVEIHMRSISSRARDSEMRFPEFFRYGIRYRPSSTDSNFLRTVMLGKLPVGTEMRDVLARIRGGEVLSASLLDTVKITGSMSARVVFRHEASAEEYVLYAKQHCIMFGDGDEKQETEVTLLTTPTYPPSPRFLSRLSSHGQSRCLSLPSFDPSISLTALERHLSGNNRVRGSMLVEMWIDESGTLHLQFSDVTWAGAAYGILTHHSSYRGLDVLFADDPCSGPVEELSISIPPRPPMRPANWAALQKRAASTIDEGEDAVEEVEGIQRKRLAALSNQKVEIPSFSGNGITGESWADEVIDESSSPPLPSASTFSVGSPTEPVMAVPPNSPIHGVKGEQVPCGVGGMGSGGNGVDAILVENFNEMMVNGKGGWWKDSGLSSQPVGLAGSKYAPPIPSISDNGTQSTSHPIIYNSSSPAHSTTKAAEQKEFRPTSDIETAGLCAFTGDTGAEADLTESESALNENPQTLQTIALHRLQILNNQAPLPTLNLNTNLIKKSPPKINLHDLLASSPSASESSSSSPSSSPRSLKDGEGVIRMPKGPSERAGFSKIMRYNSREQETDEVNLRMEISGLDVDAIDALSPVSDGVRNPDEISIELSDDEEDVEDEKNGERAKGTGEDERVG
ncbi:hypothetical protein NA56DRAFT_660363 [Hyaloscypha hepaticicola]|uniref:Uncharacterized protein n=1 Tax=Hyaloscypha hepaticicola TaxID=2082293 RepID=A0A2J6Q043_9HELO|nr:hypothetical protein NA56DRAFT_660363 [Hyaloscypha hepaticicola]